MRMPKLSIDKDAAVRAICQVLGEDYLQIGKDFRAIDQLVHQKRINWQHAAAVLNISRDKLYHWYRDTFKRYNQRQMDEEDKRKVEQVVVHRACAGLPLDSEYKQQLFYQLYQLEYEYYIYSVIFNNARQKARRIHPLQGRKVLRSEDDLLLALKSVCSGVLQGEQ